MLIVVALALIIVARFIVLILKTEGLIESLKRLILVYSKALKDTVTYPIRFKILKFRCNRIIKLGRIGYLSHNEAKIIVNRLINQHYEKFGKNYMNFYQYMDKKDN